MSDSPKKNKLIAINSKVFFLYKARFNSEWCKEGSLIQPCKEDPHAFFCTVYSEKKSCSHQGELFIFFLLQEPLERLSQTGMNES